MFSESLKISWASIRHKKLSFSLTIIGIIIGISSIVALISIGEGMQLEIGEQLDQFGADKIMIFSGTQMGPGGAASETLKEKDVEEIEDIRGVKDVSGILYKSISVAFKEESQTPYVMGVAAEDAEEFFSEMQSFKLEKGRFFRDGETKVAVAGYGFAYNIYKKDVKVRNTIEIKDTKYRIVGILMSIGNPQDDNSVYIPIDNLRDAVGEKDTFTMIMAKVSDVDRIDSTAEDIEEYLDDEYGEGAFSALTTEQLAESISGIFAMISFVLGGIASIALIVAGVGIANTMLMSIMERTRQIGLMKAIGATNKKIMEMFLIESAMIGFIGGLVGATLGVILSIIISIVAEGALPIPFSTAVTPELFFGAVGFSVLIGVISGLWPARKAAKLEIVEALRYE